MERYKNLGRDSGVIGYETNDDSIVVYFRDESKYLYDYRSSGRMNVERMKKLAARGSGLNQFINEQVKDRYAAKLR